MGAQFQKSLTSYDWWHVRKDTSNILWASLTLRLIKNGKSKVSKQKIEHFKTFTLQPPLQWQVATGWLTGKEMLESKKSRSYHFLLSQKKPLAAAVASSVGVWVRTTLRVEAPVEATAPHRGSLDQVSSRTAQNISHAQNISQTQKISRTHKGCHRHFLRESNSWNT